MNTNNVKDSVESHKVPFLFMLICILFTITGCGVMFLLGISFDDLFYSVLYSVLSSCLAVIYYKIVAIFSHFSFSIFQRYLGLLFFINPFLYIIQEYRITPGGQFIDLGYIFVLKDFGICIEIALALSLVFALMQKSIQWAFSRVKEDEIESEPYIAKKIIVNENVQDKTGLLSPGQILGQGKKDIDLVIASMMYRATGAFKTMKNSLNIMIVIVLVGGGFSVASETLNEFGVIRSLETQRTHLITLSDDLKNLRDNYSASPSGNTDTIYKVQMAKVQTGLENIRKELSDKYGEDDSYKTVIKNLEQNAVTSWQAIAMKVTIAVLTLFLVQVFFNIYKYNQQQSAHLFSKAEAMELYREASEKKEQKELRKKLFDKMESAPKFDKGPTPPTEQIIKSFEKVKRD